MLAHSRLTAGKLYQSLSTTLEEQVALQEPTVYDQISVDTASAFLDTTLSVYLVSALTQLKADEIAQFRHVIVFDLQDPLDVMVDLLRLTPEHQATFYVTDIELPLLKRIETMAQHPIPLLELPESAVIVNPAKKSKEVHDPSQGGAFHDKKAKNTKTYNYNTRDRRLMKGKVSKRKNH